MPQIFITFVLLKTCIIIIQTYLENLNKRYYETKKNQQEACKKLAISDQSFQKTLAYSQDKHQFNVLSTWINFLLLLLFITFGGFTFVENTSNFLTNQSSNSISQGLVFFLILGLVSFLVSLPFDFYSVFYIEEKHGFNRQKLKGFFLDQIKTLVISIILGGLLLSLLLWAMEQGSYWWIWAWI